MKPQISEERKTAYYFGGLLMIIGALTFASVFVTAVMNFGDFSNFQSAAKSSMIRAFLGMGLIVCGRFIRTLGARGIAGSGVVLDPGKAREDLKPYSHMTGGMLKDALDEAEIDLSGTKEKVIMIRCTSCRKLNEESAKFCQECGTKL